MAIAIYVGITGLALTRAHGNPEWFIHFGTHSTVIAEGRRVLGPGVLIPHLQGQDGETFWLMARDPLLLHAAVETRYEDRPAYRSQRVLYPLIVAPTRLLGERPMVWGLLVVNIIAVGFGTYWAAILSMLSGAPPRFSLAFALNPAIAVGVLMDASDTLALALVMWGLALWVRRRPRDVALAAIAFALAGLTKEVTMLVPLVLAISALIRGRLRVAALVAGPGILASGTWALYSRARLGWPATKIEELGWPFQGFRNAYIWGWRPFGDWAQAAVAVGCLVAMAALLAAWWRWRTDVLLAAVPFALLYPFLSAQVLDLGVNSVRATGPALTLLAIGIAAKQVRATRPGVPA